MNSFTDGELKRTLGYQNTNSSNIRLYFTDEEIEAQRS